MTLDFTLKQYQRLCQTVATSDYQARTVASYIKDAHNPGNCIVLRHDVDRFPQSALRMAQLEQSIGLSSTYYFRHTSSVFKPAIILQIANLGHEIGYHYETLFKARGDAKKALRIFELELKDFRSITPIQTISMHGSPLSPYDNRDLWLTYDFHQFDLLGEAYLSIDYEKIQYYTDTGRTWKRNNFNLRDHTPQMQPDDNVKTTANLIASIQHKRFSVGCISAHPERWAENLASWGFSLGFDLLANLAKISIRQFSR